MHGSQQWLQALAITFVVWEANCAQQARRGELTQLLSENQRSWTKGTDR